MTEKEKRPLKVKIPKSGPTDPSRHDIDYKWKDQPTIDPFHIRSTAEMMAYLESDAGKDCEVEARCISFKEGEEPGYRKLNRKSFIESYTNNKTLRSVRPLRESFDGFASDSGGSGGFSSPTSSSLGSVGNDFTPLLGGPFYKQLYYYNDWLRMHQDCFFAYHHDPFAKASVNIMVDFTLGSGFQLQVEDDVAQSLWDAFEEANELQDMFRLFAKELSAYGEDMFWWLPDNEKYIIYPRTKLEIDDVPKVVLPRVRLVDPSNFVEIITHPEDITRVLFYVWLTPTQYQIYNAKDPKTDKITSGMKLIYQQIPADQIMHVKVNAVSNEKRGRSDLFAAIPYFKRLRDSVNYSIIKDQKNSSWAIDTIVKGDQADVDNYAASQEALGTIPPAGSEFIHTEAIVRTYLGNQGSSGGKQSESFEWCLNMIAAATGIPTGYYGTHLSGGGTRASALVATEPVAKRFEMRQQIYSTVLKKMANKLFKMYGLNAGKINVTFPEIITQDRSQKLKDLYLGETAKWWAPETSARIGAKEIGIDDYDYDREMEKIKAQAANEPLWANPLTQPPGIIPTDPGAKPPSGDAPPRKPSAMPGKDKKKVKDNNGY